jgi:WD40 repeat protein
VAASPDGTFAASGYADGTVQVWNVKADTAPVVMPAQPAHGKTWGVHHISFSPNGNYVATVDLDVHIWNTHDLTKPILTIDTLSSGPTEVAFSPDDERFAVADGNTSVAIWNINGNDSPERLLVPRPYGDLRIVTWSADGKHIAAANREGGVLLWDLRSPGSPKKLLGNPIPNELAFSPDGEQLASAGDDGTLHAWNVSGAAAPVVFRGHQGGAWSVTFSSDSQQLISTGNDATIRIWNTKNTKEILELSGLRASTEAVVPVGNDRYMSAHGDGTMRIWRCPACGPITEVLTTASRHVTRELSAEERRTYLPANR